MKTITYMYFVTHEDYNIYGSGILRKLANKAFMLLWQLYTDL